MAVRPVLRMGDPRLFEVSKAVDAFDTPELHALLEDMNDTMKALKEQMLLNAQLQERLDAASAELKYPRRTMAGRS